MTEIYLVRHPESALNADRSLVGGRSNNTPVTERGLEQARRFAKVFPNHYPKPDVFYSSPAVRTKTLIDIYNEVTDEHNGYFIDSDLQELSQGIGEAKPRTDIYTAEVLAEIALQQLDFALPEGESINATADRMFASLHRMEQRHPNKTVFVAGHGLSFRTVVGRVLGWNHYETTIDPTHFTDNVSVTHLTMNDGVATVNFWGRDIIEPVEIKENTVY